MYDSLDQFIINNLLGGHKQGTSLIKILLRSESQLFHKVKKYKK